MEELNIELFSKADCIKFLQDLYDQNDLDNKAAVIRTVRDRFNAIIDEEKKEAKNAFLLAGNDEADFAYKPDALQTPFEEIMAKLRKAISELKAKRENEQQKALQAKQEVVAELEKLLESDESAESFETFKQLQAKWNDSGMVRGNNAKDVAAQYKMLTSKYYSRRSIYFELKELDRKKNLQVKQQLVEKAEALLSTDNTRQAIRSFKTLYAEFRTTGPVPREFKDELVNRMKAVSEALLSKSQQMVEEDQTIAAERLKIKEEIFAKVKALASFDSLRLKEWNEKTTELQQLQKEWEESGAFPKEYDGELKKDFWTLYKQFFKNKSAVVAKINKTYDDNLKAKKELVAKAEALQYSENWDEATEEVKKIQAEWKNVGPVPHKISDEIYNRFKKATDEFFNRKREFFKRKDNIAQSSSKKLSDLIEQLDKYATNQSATAENIAKVVEKYKEIVAQPMKDGDKQKNRFFKSLNNAITFSKSYSEEQKPSEIIRYERELSGSDSTAANRLDARGREVRNLISRLESENATMQTNLDFFGKSKNADSVRKQFEEKIASNNQQIKVLKQQLKLLKENK